MNPTRFLLAAIAVCLALPASAQEMGSPNKTGKVMSYYVRSGENAPATPAPNTAARSNGFLNMVEKQKPAPEGEEAAETPQSIEKESAEAAWDRYKTLASGTSSADEPPKIDAPTPPQSPSIEAPAPVSSTGIDGLIQKYENAKAKRSQMNTLRVSAPTAPTPPVNPASAAQP